MLTEPLDFHIQELAQKYGHIEILQSLIDSFAGDFKYAQIAGYLEKARDAMGEIIRNGKNFEAGHPEKVNRQLTETQNGESI